MPSTLPSPLRLVCALALALGLAAGAGPARAEPATIITITVNTTGDEFGSGGSCSMREALQTANTDTNFGGCTRASTSGSGADTILVPNGTFTLTRNGVSEDANATGDLDITASVVISSTGTSVPTIRGESNWDDRILDLIGGPVTIKRTNIGFGNAPDGRSGGGVLVNTGVDATISNSTVGNNVADQAGGGIVNNGELFLFNSTVADNEANGNLGGGGIYNGENATLILNNTNVDDNEATNGPGGGIYSDDNSQIFIDDSTISDNTSNIPVVNAAGFGGGGIYFGGLSFDMEGSTVSGNAGEPFGGGLALQGSNHVIRESVISNNEVNAHASFTFAAGGGISGFKLLVERSIISGNTANFNIPFANGESQGGGLNAGIEVTVIDSLVSGNEAIGASGSTREGGGIYAHGDTLRLVNTTLSGNTTEGYGGGLAVEAQVDAMLHNVTITNNEAGDAGGGLRAANLSVVIVGSSIVAGNEDRGISGDEDDCSGSLISHAYNLIGSSNGCSLVSTNNKFDVSAQLAGLADNGGYVAGDGAGFVISTHALLNGSPAIDAGDPNGCEDAEGELLQFDQRGFARAVDGPGSATEPRCDMGAFEAGSFEVNFNIFLPLVLK